MTETDSVKMKPVFDLALQDLEKMFKGHFEPDNRSKIAVSVLGTYSRLKGTEIHAEALRFQVIKDISKDKEELSSYIATSMPEYNVKKKLSK